MKKLLTILIGCIIMLSVSITSYAAKDETDTYEYEIRDGKAVLTKYATTSNAVRVAVPDEVDGYQVIGLEGTFEQNQHVEEVVLPEGIDFLGANTFSRCRKLRTITLPDSLTAVGDSCFSYTQLESIEFPANVNSIGYGCIQNSNVVKIKICCKNSEASINFGGSENLEEVDLSESNIDDISAYAFRYCIRLKTVYLPDTLKKIGEGAFSECMSLNNVVLPEKLEIITDSAFKKCRSLESLSFSDTLKEIGEDAFSGCIKLNNIVLPRSMEKIGTDAFYGCDSIEEFIIPDTDKSLSIGRLFVSGENLKRIVNNSNMDYDEGVYADYERFIDSDRYYFKKYQYMWYFDEKFTQKIKYLPANTTIFRKDNLAVDPDDVDNLFLSMDTLEEEYAKRYLKKLIEVKKTGVSMSVVNTQEQAVKYIESLAPEGKDERLSVEVVVNSHAGGYTFIPAWAGTAQMPDGKNGSFPIRISVTNTEENDGRSAVIHRSEIPIIATPYKKTSSGGSGGGSSSGGSSGGGGSSSGSKSGNKNNSDAIPGNGLTITKPSITGGTWEQAEGKWKLKTSDNIYANSQWANVDNQWYLFGQDGIMLTDWQKVNGKWYLLGQGGDMLTGWQFHNGKWYYMEASGEMTVGWKWILDKCYYMDANGAMLADTTTPDGYKVNKNGEWVQ